ncbi:hypothetical protein EV363DRAFT_1178316 [Boletus edulis]|nr:hypothetical protein EV363DRAFT_1178316 [Boletus edulis]
MQELTSMGLKTVIPQIMSYNTEFPWQPDEFIVWDKKWVNISSYPNPQPYFYNRCLHASKVNNSKATVFRTMQFNLFVVVLEKQWLEYEKYKEKHEQDKVTSMPDSLAMTPP